MPTQSSTAPKRRTRDYVFDVLNEIGIKYIFGVPGTNEIPIIDGCTEDGVQYIECLHENIAMGAAMGYARMSGKPGVVLVHVTPGIAHCIGNLFNGSRARTPLVVLACQQQNELVTQEPLLSSNLVKLAEQYTKWAHEVRVAEEMPLVLQRAFKEAMAPPNGPVFISIPWDFNLQEIPDGSRVRGVTRIPPHFTGDPSAVEAAAELLAQASAPVIVVGDGVGYTQSWSELSELAKLIGAPVYSQTFSSVANFPNDEPSWQGELPGDQAGLQSLFGKRDCAFFCGFGAQAQITVFKYEDQPLIPDSVKQVYLSNNTWDIGKNYFGDVGILGDIKATLPLLKKAVEARQSDAAKAAARQRNEEMAAKAEQRRTAWNEYLEDSRKQKAIRAVLVADALSKVIDQRELKKKFVYVHEAVSDPSPFQYLLPFTEGAAAPVSYYCVPGGSLGWSMPASLGIKLTPSAGPQGILPELVINAVGDGSSLFYPQVWWTAAHRKLPILYLIMNNREYRTLQVGLQQVISAYAWQPATNDPAYLRIQGPEVDFVSLAKAFGVTAGRRVSEPLEVERAIQEAVSHVLEKKEPYVLELWTDQSPQQPPAVLSLARMAAPADQPRRQPLLDVFREPSDDALLTSAAVIP